jgi:tetratricopeptide (TPR) repeat protein
MAAAAAAQAGNEFFTQPSWEPATSESAFKLLNQHLAATGVTPDRQTEIQNRWQTSAETQDDLLDRLATVLARTDERVAELTEFCAGVSKPGPLPEFAWLADSATPQLVRNNLRLYLARWLVQQGYYDEALSWTEGLDTGDVVAPEALLFYRAVAHHRLLQLEKADAALSQLLEREDDLPTRYQKLAGLMQQDLAALDAESLDHIARRMDDIRRRLAQGRTGKRVQGVENGVIESLDKLIKQAEDQMQQQQSQSSQTPSGQPQSTPLQDSQIAELKAPGTVERRDIGRGTGWGNVPERDREKALQEIGREFPSHYREVIEEYFRRLAAEESAEQP